MDSFIGHAAAVDPGAGGVLAHVSVSAPELAIAYQRPSTACLPIKLVNKYPCVSCSTTSPVSVCLESEAVNSLVQNAPQAIALRSSSCSNSGEGDVLFQVRVGICNTPDGDYVSMARAEYTLQIGTFSAEPPSASLGPEVSHELAWHALAPGLTSLVKISPLERPANTGRYMRVSIAVRSFSGAEEGGFLTEPRVIMSRAGAVGAILKVLGDRPASEARAIGQQWLGNLRRHAPPGAASASLPALAKALSAAATRVATRKSSKRSRRTTPLPSLPSTDSGDSGSEDEGVASGSSAEREEDEGEESYPGLRPYCRLAGSKRSAAEATARVEIEPRPRRAAPAARASAAPASAPGRASAPPALASVATHTILASTSVVPALLPIEDGAAPRDRRDRAVPASPAGLDLETSLSLSVLLEDDEARDSAAAAAAQPPAAAVGKVSFPPCPPIHLLRSLSQNLELFHPGFAVGRSAVAVTSPASGPIAPLLAAYSPFLGARRSSTTGDMNPAICARNPAPHDCLSLLSI